MNGPFFLNALWGIQISNVFKLNTAGKQLQQAGKQLKKQNDSLKLRL